MRIETMGTVMQKTKFLSEALTFETHPAVLEDEQFDF